MIPVYQNSLPLAVTHFSPLPELLRVIQNLEYTRALDMSLLEVIQKRGIYQASEYASGSEYTKVLNMLGLRRVLICLNMPK